MTIQNVDSIIGYIAGVLIVTSNCIQMYTMYKTRDVSGISYNYIILYTIVAILYIIAGILDNLPYIYFVNSVSCIQMIGILLLKYRYRNRNSKKTITINIDDMENSIYEEV